MSDFFKIDTRPGKRGVTEIYPKFIVGKPNDLMIRGSDFYAIWMEERGLWSTDEQDVIRTIDRELRTYADEYQKTHNNGFHVLYMWDAESGMEKLNRTLDGPYGIPIDIIVGTFLIVGLTEDDFGELLPEFVEKYEKMFHQPRKFVTYTDSEGKVHLDVDYCTPEE